MDKKTKLIIGGIALAFMAYVLFRKAKKAPTPTPTPDPTPKPEPVIDPITDPILNPLPVDTLPPTKEEELHTMAVAYGETKEAACLNKSIPTVTLYMKTEQGLSPNNTIFYTDSSYKTPVKSGYYAEKFDLCLFVSEGGVLTEMTMC